VSAAAVGLITGAIGVLGTLAGVLFTQWRADVRERDREAAEERREERRIANEAERERDARLFDYRRNAYVSVIEQYHRWSSVGSKVERGEVAEPPEDAMDDFWRLVGEVELYGGHEVGSAAQDLYFTLYGWVFNWKSSKEPGWDALDGYAAFLDAARVDLGVPPRPKPTPYVSTGKDDPWAPPEDAPDDESPTPTG